MAQGRHMRKGPRPRPRRRMRRGVALSLAVLVFLVGAACLAYPFVTDYLYRRAQEQVTWHQGQAVQKAEPDVLAAERSEALAYNERLLNGRTVVTDPFDPTQERVTAEDYGRVMDLAGDGVMGAVVIPAVGVDVPIYHGTNEAELERGAGHLETTSLPYGGPSAHSVIAGHTGLPSGKIFDNIDRLQVGDYFVLRVLGEEHAYRVQTIETVLPEQTDSLVIVPGHDLCTLVTCTPYGINSHRLLVHGERCELPQEWLDGQVVGASLPAVALRMARDAGPLGYVVVGVVLAFALLALVAVARRRRHGQRVGRLVSLLVGLCAFAVGCVLVAYPLVDAATSQVGANRMLTQAMRQAREESGLAVTEAGYRATQEDPAYEYLLAYNDRVRRGAAGAVNDPWGLGSDAGEMEGLGLPDGIVGALTVPSIDVTLPVYLGATGDHLASGAAVVAGTSAPLGQPGDNCVVAAHRGVWSGLAMFRDLGDVAVGDAVALETPWATLSYRVAGVAVISPYDADEVADVAACVPGHDLLTLITCHPYGMNSQRLCVVCERVEGDDAAAPPVPYAAVNPSRLVTQAWSGGQASPALTVERWLRLAGAAMAVGMLVVVVRHAARAGGRSA